MTGNFSDTFSHGDCAAAGRLDAATVIGAAGVLGRADGDDFGCRPAVNASASSTVTGRAIAVAISAGRRLGRGGGAAGVGIGDRHRCAPVGSGRVRAGCGDQRWTTGQVSVRVIPGTC